MKPIIKKIASDFKAELQKLYGEELTALILFGSYARNDYKEFSDIDFAVVLKNPNTTSTSEIFKISDISLSLGLKYNQLISYIGVSQKKLVDSSFGIYQEIRKDGIYI